MKLVNVGAEVSSMVKWNAVLIFINGGILLIVFSQMSTVNHCDKNLVEAFFYPGAWMSGLGCLGLAFAVLTEWIIPLGMRLWKWLDE